MLRDEMTVTILQEDVIEPMLEAEVKIDDMAATVEVDRELDQFIKAHALGKQRGKMHNRSGLDGLGKSSASPADKDTDSE